MSENKGYKECPFCSEKVLVNSIRCGHCQSMLIQKTVDSVNIIDEQNRPVPKTKNDHDISFKDYTDDTNITKAKTSLIMGIVSLILFLFNAFFSLIPSGFGLYFGIKGFNTSKKAFALVGIILCSIILFFSLFLSGLAYLSNNEIFSERQLHNSASSLNAQISRLRAERSELEREKNMIQRLIDEHDRISSRSSLTESDERRLSDISRDLMRHSRYINYIVSGSGILISPELNNELDERIKEIRLLELELEGDLALIEYQLKMRELYD